LGEVREGEASTDPGCPSGGEMFASVLVIAISRMVPAH
jgi:hypothetical protein